MVLHGFWWVSMVFMIFGWFPWCFKVVSWFLIGFHGFSRWFHGFMVFGWFPWFFRVVSWFFMVFEWFPWFFKVVSWFFNGLWLVSMVLLVENTTNCILAQRSSLGLAGRGPALAKSFQKCPLLLWTTWTLPIDEWWAQEALSP